MAGNMRSPEAFVSAFRYIGRKRETKGNETGNERETKRSLLCKIGNGVETRIGNEGGFFGGLRFPVLAAEQVGSGIGGNFSEKMQPRPSMPAGQSPLQFALPRLRN
jgi:hypothetical protein